MGRSVSIHLFNNSSVILTNPQVYSISGSCVRAPQPTVEKGASVMCAFGKTAGTVRGAVGVLTYDIAEDQEMEAVKRLAIMFSVPYDYNLFKNVFALGLAVMEREEAGLCSALSNEQ
ncbi:hypothetical protein COCON_G00070960 [Conger conger]|uniref:Uncharacterized protein n=1 Tax=Conger conger TaxID=82655 RepID=A0A9Q1DT98_CONCO|nr:hypothetical protein COCON_G00070960 [Conger conger]